MYGTRCTSTTVYPAPRAGANAARAARARGAAARRTGRVARLGYTECGGSVAFRSRTRISPVRPPFHDTNLKNLTGATTNWLVGTDEVSGCQETGDPDAALAAAATGTVHCAVGRSVLSRCWLDHTACVGAGATASGAGRRAAALLDQHLPTRVGGGERDEGLRADGSP